MYFERQPRSEQPPAPPGVADFVSGGGACGGYAHIITGSDPRLLSRGYVLETVTYPEVTEGALRRRVVAHADLHDQVTTTGRGQDGALDSYQDADHSPLEPREESMKPKIAFVTAAASVLGAGAAHAVTGSPITPTPPPAPTLSTYSFTGTCSDCSATPTTATATLDLQNYTPGQELSGSNFVDLTYTSTKVGTLTFTTPYAFASLTGNLGATAGAYNVSFSGKTATTSAELLSAPSYTFSTDKAGNFTLSQQSTSNVLDVGTSGTWSPAATNAVSAAPEPESWALMLGGVAAMGAAIRTSRRRRPAARAA